MNRRIRSQSAVSFTLSFLDVLCCGLGAATLLLLVLKHGPTPNPIKEEHSVVPIDIASIEQEIAIKTEEKTELEMIAQDQIVFMNQVTEDANSQNKASESERLKFVNLVGELQRQRAALKQAQATLADLEASSPEEVEEEQAESPSVGTHLTGLKVSPDRVLILLDASASMLSTTLVEIIRLRASSLPEQQQAPKWRSARSAAMWIYDKIPENGNFQIFTYSDSVADLRGKTPSRGAPSNWIMKGDPTLTESAIEQTLANRKAFGPTDLETALRSIFLLKPTPHQVVLISDGLPTLPGTSALGRLRDCPRSSGSSTVLLSPQCRASVMRRAVNSVRRDVQKVRIDVILFPLEGDANAVLPYWQLADSTGGRLLSPVPGWPNS